MLNGTHELEFNSTTDKWSAVSAIAKYSDLTNE